MTQKQKAVAKILSEKIGTPIGQAMREVGYSESTANTPQRLTETKGWAELQDKYREALLADGLDHIKMKDKVKEWLDAKKIQTSHTEPDRLVPDYQIQIKAGEMLREDLGFKQANTLVQNNFYDHAKEQRSKYDTK